MAPLSGYPETTKVAMAAQAAKPSRLFDRGAKPCQSVAQLLVLDPAQGGGDPRRRGRIGGGAGSARARSCERRLPQPQIGHGPPAEELIDALGDDSRQMLNLHRRWPLDAQPQRPR